VQPRYRNRVSWTCQAISARVGKWTRQNTHLAGHPSLNCVLDILVLWSNISTRWAPSTAGSHSCLSSGVMKTAFQASRRADSSVADTSRTTRYTFSPDFVVLRWTITSVSSGLGDTLDFPFGSVVVSEARETCFQSPELYEVSSWRKLFSAAPSASDHA